MAGGIKIGLYEANNRDKEIVLLEKIMNDYIIYIVCF